MRPLVAIPATAALVYRAYSRKSLTPLGILAAAITAIIHAAHPSSAPFAFLVVFFLGGTAVTKVKADVKARLTTSSMGGGAEGPRTHIQVLSNSAIASILVLVHLWRGWMGDGNVECLAYGAKDGLLLVGITANYAVVAADTYSSELGILSKSSPRLVTSPTLRKVPKGTNGGVTLAGLFGGVLGALTIALTSLILLPCSTGTEAWTGERKAAWVLAVTIWGTLGSVVDSVLGGLLQATVVDKRTGKVVEGIGGSKVLVNPGSMSSSGQNEVSIRRGSHIHTTEDIANTLTPRATKTEYDPLASEPRDQGDHGDDQSRKVDAGNDLLDNNQINLLMAALMSIGGMGAASYVWDITF